jgi:hypothetical protein
MNRYVMSHVRGRHVQDRSRIRRNRCGNSPSLKWAMEQGHVCVRMTAKDPRPVSRQAGTLITQPGLSVSHRRVRQMVQGTEN